MWLGCNATRESLHGSAYGIEEANRFEGSVGERYCLPEAPSEDLASSREQIPALLSLWRLSHGATRDRHPSF